MRFRYACHVGAHTGTTRVDGISSWPKRSDFPPDLLGGFSLDRMDESRKYESNDDYHRAHIYHGHRKHRLSAYDTGNELPGALAQCSQRTGYRGGLPNAVKRMAIAEARFTGFAEPFPITTVASRSLEAVK